jgi:hypothetical protein
LKRQKGRCSTRTEKWDDVNEADSRRSSNDCEEVSVGAWRDKMTHTTLLFGWNSGVHGYTAKQRQWEPQGGVRARVPRQDMLVHVSSRGRPKERRCFLTRFPLFRAPSHPTLTPLSLVSSLSLSLSLSHLKSTKFSCSLSLLGLYLLGSSAPSLSLSSISNNFSWKHESEFYMNVITLFFKLFFI